MKREGDSMSLVITEKRPRHELITIDNGSKQLLAPDLHRTSSLESPIMLLTGHQSEINSCKFHPNGQTLMSAGFDRNILLWNAFDECKSYAVLNGGHKGAILDVQYSSSGDQIYSSSTDKSVIIWDAPTCARIKKLTGHQSFVNACCPSRDPNKALLVSVSDDRSIRIWDTRKRSVVSSYKDDFQLTAVTFNESADQVIVGGIENVLKVYDIRKNKILYTMPGHFDTITGLALSPDGNFVLSNSMDNSLCIWDIRPFIQTDRCVKTLTGHQHNFEKNLLRCAWSPDGKRVTGGSADRFVYIWDVYNKRILYKLPGHTGSVNEVVFHPNEPIGFCKWEFIWGDEFEGDTLNLDEWYFDLGCSGWGNEELQCYTENRHENVRVEDGNLVINVQVEEYDGHDFTSARLKSKTAWTYGYFETRVKLPSGHHLWPAIRMMPQDNVYGEWAASGEIDIMEFSGDDLHGIQGTIHCGGTAPNNIRFGSDQRHFPFDFSEDFHVFAIDWSPYGFRFVIDGNEYHWEGIEKSMWSGKGENPYTADGQPFDQSFFWILNIAVGGTFFGDGPYVTPDEARDWPKPTMEVDYVRVWRYAPD